MRFQIGQTVRLVSAMHPELSGPQTISAVEAGDSSTLLERNNAPYAGPCYGLEGIEGLWAEHALQEIDHA